PSSPSTRATTSPTRMRSTTLMRPGASRSPRPIVCEPPSAWTARRPWSAFSPLSDRIGTFQARRAPLSGCHVDPFGVPSPGTIFMPETRITVAHSPDSDDAFMFYGLASNNVDTGGIVVDQVLADIETLNRAAFEGKYEVTAVSFHAFAHLADKYALLPHGASMGDNYGPIVVARADGGPSGVKGSRIAIPGTLTTAYLAL